MLACPDTKPVEVYMDAIMKDATGVSYLIFLHLW
jgi:hypothetical protein